MELRTRTAMEALYRLCVIVSGAAMVLISAIIPWGVFTRYVLNSAASWPEPTAVLLAIVLPFFGAAACYRVSVHMNVTVLVRMLSGRPRWVAELGAEAGMGLISSFMVFWGGKLVAT